MELSRVGRYMIPRRVRVVGLTLAFAWRRLRASVHVFYDKEDDVTTASLQVITALMPTCNRGQRMYKRERNRRRRLRYVTVRRHYGMFSPFHGIIKDKSYGKKWMDTAYTRGRQKSIAERVV